MKKFWIAFRFIRPIMAYTVIVFSFAYWAAVSLNMIPKANREMASQIVGNLQSVVTIILAYYFGTAKDKSDAEQKEREDKVTNKPE